MNRLKQYPWPLIIGTATAAFIAGFAAVIIAGRIIPSFDEHTETDTTISLVELIPARMICGAEISTTVDVEVEHSFDHVPNWIAGTGTTGQAVGSALACTTTDGATIEPIEVEIGEAVTITVDKPQLMYSWLDMSRTAPPERGQAGLIDRAYAGFECLFGDCSSVNDDQADWYNASLVAVEQAGMEAEAVDYAEAETVGAIRDWISLVHSGPVTVVFKSGGVA